MPAGRPARPLGRRQKALTLVPVALLSGAWMASLFGLGSATADSPGHGGDGRLPDGTRLPGQAVQAPASVPAPGEIAPGVPEGTGDDVVDGASTSGIPSAALSAYQRAAQIVDRADARCHLPWQVIAAIGRVESDHGRYAGNVLGANGVSRPGVFGIPLDGRNGTQRVQDTDAGALDDDPVYDRAVGPMQFIPGTWSVVKVDADGDGKRNPQDIDDAALATGVYLCSGTDDVGTRAGQERAVYRYNHSREYVDLVLRIADAYRTGDYTAVPDGTSGGSLLAPSSSRRLQVARSHAKSTVTKHEAAHGGSSGSGGSAGAAPAGTATGGGTSSGGGSGSSSGGSGGSLPVPVPTKVPKPAQPVVKTLGQLGQATSWCQANLPTAVKALPGAVGKCSGMVADKTAAQARAALPGIIEAIKDALGGLL